MRRNPNSLSLVVATLMLSLVLVGCNDSNRNSRAAFVLIDISEDYASELSKARSLSHYLLANLNSGDSLAVAFIDNSSFTERNIIAQATFDHRPSLANAQKRQFQQELDAFMERFRVPSHHSDITGGVLLALDYLNETRAGHKHLFLLSNLEEDVPPWLNRDLTLELEGVQVSAINVKRRDADNRNPLDYQQRLSAWQQRVEAGGGQWQVVNDLARLDSAVTLR